MADLIEILRKHPNPFLTNAVTGPYDTTELPCVEEYVEQPKFQILQGIEAYSQGRLSNPLLVIYGEPGSGKSFLLRLLARESHKQKKHFWV